MTPQESVTAYESWCSANKSFRIAWMEAASSKTATVHMTQTVAVKVVEIIPVASESMAISISRVASVPTLEGYKEWLQYQ